MRFRFPVSLGSEGSWSVSVVTNRTRTGLSLAVRAPQPRPNKLGAGNTAVVCYKNGLL